MPTEKEVVKFCILKKSPLPGQGTTDRFFYFWVKILSYSYLLETLDSDRGQQDLDLSAKMEVLDPSRAEIWRYL